MIRLGWRPVVCALLVVSTTIGMVTPITACVCSPIPKPNLATFTQTPKTPQVSAAPASQPCCNRPCCKANRHAESPGCCCEAPPAQPDTQKSTSKQVDGNNQDCGAAGCDCGVPEIPPTPPAPIPAASDAADFAQVRSPVPPLFLPTPSAASRTVPASVPRTPTDLIISLSRLTC